MQDNRQSGLYAAAVVLALVAVGIVTSLRSDTSNNGKVAASQPTRTAKLDQAQDERRPVWIAPTPTYKHSAVQTERKRDPDLKQPSVQVFAPEASPARSASAQQAAQGRAPVRIRRGADNVEIVEVLRERR